ncbi:MAG: DUF4262 domain-containing protein [Rhodovibrio sp.]|nr:DUF4262 domain-containing protein [Rhodovibrio sp.]
MDLEQVRSAILGNVEQHGWHIAGVNEDTGNGFPQYAYTVGFGDTLNHPEVIVIGLSHEKRGHAAERGGRADPPSTAPSRPTRATPTCSVTGSGSASSRRPRTGRGT